MQVLEDFDEASKALPAAFPNLKGLVLGDAITDADLEHLRHLGHLLPQLCSVEMNGCDSVTDIGLSHVAHLTALTRLELRGADGISDCGMACLSWLPALHTLTLTSTDVTDAGVLSVLRLPALRSLDIRDCWGITAASLVKLLSHDSDVAKKAASDAVCGHNSENVLAAGALPRLVALLAHSSANTADSAVAALARLAVTVARCGFILNGRLPAAPAAAAVACVARCAE